MNSKRVRNQCYSDIKVQIVVCILLFTKLGCSPGVQQPNDLSRASGTFLIASPDPINFGKLQPGEVSYRRLTIRNPRAEGFSVHNIETTCDCIKVTPNRCHISPGEEFLLRVEFNSSEDPEFRGKLGVVIRGISIDGLLLFKSTASIDVTN